MAWIVMTIMLTLANFIYQAFTTQDWGTAFERSWFQGWAILVVYLVKPWE